MTEPSSVRESPAAPPGSPSRWRLRLAVFAVAASLAAVFLYQFRSELSLPSLAKREAQFRAFYDDHAVETLAIAFLVYVIVTGLSLPGAAAMSVLYGWLFGFWPALVLVSFASTTGATIAFLLSRYLIGQTIQARYGERLTALNAAVERDGAVYLFTLRLIPPVPFFIVNVA